MTKTGCLRLGLAGLILMSLGACATFTYQSSRYGHIKGVNVQLRCRDTYEVFDRADAGALLVVTNLVNETLAGCFDGGPDTVTRMREVVRIYLVEKTKRPLCRVTQEEQLTSVHREFFYRCPDDGEAASPRLRRNL